MIFGFLRRNPQREARQLNRDARSVVDRAVQTYRDEILRETARLTRAGLAQLADLCGDDADCRSREVGRFQTLHREARRQFNEAGLTAYTLIIIHARSAACGSAGAPARAAIDEFLEQWPADLQDEGTLPG